MHRRSCKQYIFWSIQTSKHFDDSLITYQWEKEDKKALRVSDLTFLLVIVKWCHGSEGVQAILNGHFCPCFEWAIAAAIP